MSSKKASLFSHQKSSRPSQKATNRPSQKAADRISLEVTDRPSLKVAGRISLEVTDRPSLEEPNRPSLEESDPPSLEESDRPSLEESDPPSLVRIFLQGTEWSMNHVAAINTLGLRQGMCEFVYCESYPELFRAYGQSVRERKEQLGEAESELAAMALIQHSILRRIQDPYKPIVLDYTIQYAFVPIENTLSGTSLEHYELMRAQDEDVQICGEVSMHAELCLCCLPEDDWGTLTTVLSDAMALAQCAGYLRERPELRQVQVSDGSLMAQRIAQYRLKGCATICHPMAARHRGLRILSSSVQDSGKSMTRYLLIGNEGGNVFERPASGGARATKLFKLSLCFVLKDGVHTLADMLAHMRAHGLQLTSLYSLPITGQVGRYRFYSDWVFIQTDNLITPDYKRYLEEYSFLGIYSTEVLSKQILRLHNEQKA